MSHLILHTDLPFPNTCLCDAENTMHDANSAPIASLTRQCRADEIDESAFAARQRDFHQNVADGNGSTIHEQLIDVRISAGLLRRQLGQGSLEEAEDTLENLMCQLLRLDREIVANVF